MLPSTRRHYYYDMKRVDLTKFLRLSFIVVAFSTEIFIATATATTSNLLHATNEKVRNASATTTTTQKPRSAPSSTIERRRKHNATLPLLLPLADAGGVDAAAILSLPQFQAPDDICTGGIPLTRLSAPVVCNPTASNCPDGYYCTLHSRTGTSYCCQNVVEPIVDSALCAGNQITYFDPLNGLPKSCVLGSSSSCPVGFGCNLVGGAFTRCCGRNFGCPVNSAGYAKPQTGAHLQCNTANPTSCPQGFVCTQSSMFNTGICCSDTSNTPTDVCGSGDSPLSRPNPCSATSTCPTGFACRNGRCCPSKGLCPVGNPLGGVTSCSAANPCPNNYQCVTNNGQQYCCPAPEHICGRPRDSGVPCESRVTAVSRYYFDASTGSCRTFQYSQCGGNANNFDTLEQCESFCLDAQCPVGTGLRAGPALATCAGGSSLNAVSPQQQFFPASKMSAATSAAADSTCPSHYACVQPLFGSNHICCTSNENVCRDTVTSGTACFGAFTTTQRFHYDAERGQCEPFQYYGCNGSGNNFLTKKLCENACQPPVRNACNGVAPLNDEGDYVQRCSDSVPCPRGSWCNSRGYCCPHTETACQAPRSIGHTCLSQRPGTYWYFDTAAETCLPFIYSGCGGTPNRFASREACEQMCVNKLGDCPRGMTPFLTTAGTKQCALNVAGSCPDGSSCVLSTFNEPICCASTAQCPVGRAAYLIPGSDSHVACLPDDDNCPHGHQCVQSSNVPGFYMCCASGVGARRRVPPTSALSNSAPFSRNSPDASSLRVATLIDAIKENSRRGASANLALSPQRSRQSAAASSARYYGATKCPAGLHTNGQRCTVNEIEGCPHGYLCLSGSGNDATGNSKGVCCKAAPKCHKRRKPYFVGKKQVLTCGDDEAGCPRGSSCTSSSIDGVNICCLLRSGPATAPSTSTAELSEAAAAASAAAAKKKMDNSGEGNAEGEDTLTSSHSTFSKVSKVVPKCHDGALPYFALGSRVPQSCKAARDDECPEEYECDLASDGEHYCCPAWDRCPLNASPFLVEGSRKPLGCNWMANNCPEGYSCEGSKDRAICCRSRPSNAQCPSGRSAFLYAKRPLICPPGKKTCPPGYDCTPSKGSGLHLCCSNVESTTAECVSGHAYFDPATSKNQLCDPILDSCPNGYECSRSTLANAHVCCTEKSNTDSRYDGYCPPGQIPYTGLKSDYSKPPTCHMAKNPCPTTAPYQCIYSPEKEDSYCCAPVDSAHKPSKSGYRNYASKKGKSKQNNNNAAPTPEQQQQMLMQQQQENYQQQLQQQQQQQYAAAEYAAAMQAAAAAASSAPSAMGKSGCTGAAAYNSVAQSMSAVPSTYPTYSQYTQQQQQQQSRQQQQYLSGSSAAGVETNAPQYPPTTVIDQSAANKLFVASCPPWSKPLLNPQTQLGHVCSTWNRCPSGFTCYSNFPDGRNAHCCTTVPLDNQVVFRANTPEAEAAAAAAAQAWSQQAAEGAAQQQFAPNRQMQYAPEMSEFYANSTPSSPSLLNATALVNPAAIATAFSVQCPPGTVNIGGQCKRMYFVGQQGCETDAQCRERTNGTHCHKNYCSCDPGLLIYESKCIQQCPEGFLNIAGRCHDLTTVVFMDSVEERENGTIGGYCFDTVVRNEQCNVSNAYCNERSITCQCMPGFELHMDFGNKNDSGSCQQVEDSKYNETSEKNSTKLLLDQPIDKLEKNGEEISALRDRSSIMQDDENDELKSVNIPRTFFAIGVDDDADRANATETSINNSSKEVEEIKNKEKNKVEKTVTTESTKKEAQEKRTTDGNNSESTTTPLDETMTNKPEDVQRIINTKFNGTTNEEETNFFFQSDDK